MKKLIFLTGVLLLSVIAVNKMRANDRSHEFVKSSSVSLVHFLQEDSEELSSSTANDSITNDSVSKVEDSSKIISIKIEGASSVITTEAEDNESTEKVSFHQGLKKRFIEGGPTFMGIVLLALILGLAVAIERILFLNLSTTNVNKLVIGVEDALSKDGIESAKEFCRNTKGPIASIFYQGLDRLDEGVESAEKAVIGYGGVQMGLLEKNLSWLSLFIALAPMLGFMGTVIGMIEAFDQIQSAGTMEPSLVAGGIKVALLTTVFGLIVAIILQIFYNYIVAKIDSIVNNMEDASISLIDILVAHKNNK